MDSDYQNSMICGPSSKEYDHYKKELQTKVEGYKCLKKKESNNKDQTKTDGARKRVLTREDAIRSVTPEEIYFLSKSKIKTSSPKSTESSSKSSSENTHQLHGCSHHNNNLK